jgi:hypothetical protein
MTLADIVRQKVAENPPRAGRHALLVAAGGWSLNLTLDRKDELGCLVWELVLQRSGASPAEETLRSWAERIVRQATGLLESLKIIEIDDQRHEGLLRSSAPSQWKGKNSYYELLLQGTSRAWVRRYQADDAGTARRQQVAFALTYDALAKLAGDLTSAK